MEALKVKEINPLCACVCASPEARRRVAESVVKSYGFEPHTRGVRLIERMLEVVCEKSPRPSLGAVASLMECQGMVNVLLPADSEPLMESVRRLVPVLRRLADTFAGHGGRCPCADPALSVDTGGAGEEVEAFLRGAFPHVEFRFSP